MSVHEERTQGGAKRYKVKWRDGGRGTPSHSRTFTRRRDAEAWDAEVERRRQLGPIAVQTLDAGRESLDEYVTGTWAKAHAAHLTEKTRAGYGSLYDAHIGPFLGPVPLRELTPDRIAVWQTQRQAAGAGVEAIRKAHTLLGNVLQRAVESQRIAHNPQRSVRKLKPSPKREVRPLAPQSVEAMRRALWRDTTESRHRDATIVSILAYAGLRPGEARELTWGNVHDKTIVVNASKTGQRRTVRLLTPLASDLAAWKLDCTATASADPVFPSVDGRAFTVEAFKSWGRRAFARAAAAADRPDATPYTARHSFASLLLHEGRNVIYVARQLGHGANLTLLTYGHVIDELDGEPQLPAEDAIRIARGNGVPVVFLPEA